MWRHISLLQLRKAITLREECNELIYSCSPDVSLQKVRLVNSFYHSAIHMNQLLLLDCVYHLY